jgi:hypothetical protein
MKQNTAPDLPTTCLVAGKSGAVLVCVFASLAWLNFL